MDRRGFLSWLRSAPVAVPALAASAVAVSASRIDGNSLYLGDKRVMTRTEDGEVVICHDLDLSGTPTMRLFAPTPTNWVMTG